MGMAPLPHEYMITGIIGFFISIFWIQDQTWAFAIGLFCLLLVIASLVSMSGSDVDVEGLVGEKK